jgi:cell fate regulator YaaT (PSP1 superfamily)
METNAKYYLGVKFPGANKSYYFSTDDNTLKIGDYVIVETVSGYEMGIVAVAPMSTSIYSSSLELKPIIRKSNEDDINSYNFNLREAKTALKVTEEEIKRLNLPMHLLDACYTLDGSKITITYTSENRVDFRELLRVLAPQLHCRIELRQIASRDKAKMIGGIGICGLPLCCSTFLNQFDGISISRAKNQMLTLNIPKLSGHCGKLICCLLYEDDMYTEAKKAFPSLGSVIHLDGSEYTVQGFNILSKSIKIVSPLEVRYITLDEYNEISKRNAKSYASKEVKH